VYIDVKDPANSTTGVKTASSFKIKNNEKITVDSIQYAVVDDATRFRSGYNELAVYRSTVRFIFTDNENIIVDTRDNRTVNADNNDF
jgi:hypothetical protein